MSHVDNVMVSFGILDRQNVEDRLTEGLDFARGQNLMPLTDGETSERWGGHKFPETDVYAAAFNFLPWDDFASWIVGLPWEYPDDVQVFVQWQYADKWSVWEIVGGDLKCVLGERDDAEIYYP